MLAAVLALVLYQLAPQHVPLARSGDYAALREAIWARVNNDVGDPLVEVLPGVSVRESNIRGFSLQGETYYYYFEGQRNFDPLSRGKVDQRGIEIVARDDGGPKPLVIYRLRAG